MAYSSALPSDVWEVNGSRTETYARDKFSANISYICRWGERVTKLLDLQNTIYNPMFAEENDDAEFFTGYYPPLVMSATMKPLGPEGNTVATTWTESNAIQWQPYTRAQIDLQYEGVARGTGAMTQTVTPSIGMRTLPSWGYYWRSDGSPVLDKEAPALMQYTMKIQRNLQGVRRIPQWFFLMGGKTNGNPWTDMIAGGSYLPGTLLFNPLSMDRTINLHEDQLLSSRWNLQFEINWNPIGWNNFQRPHGVDQIMYQGQQYYMYPAIDYPTMVFDTSLPEGHPDQMMGSSFQVTTQRYSSTGQLLSRTLTVRPNGVTA